jgi:uncharacterized membrane protein
MRLTLALSIPILAALAAACADSAPTAPGSRTAPPSLSRFDQPLSFTTIDVPGASSTTPQGINARGDIVGWYAAGGVTRGFLLSGGTFATLVVPNAIETQARGIGPNGEIVGTYRLTGETSPAIHGFHRTPDGAFTPVHYPGHLYEIPQRILADGTILGCRHDNDLMVTMRGIEIGPSGSGETEVFASMHNGGTPDGRRIVGLYTNMDAGNRPEGYVIENGVFTPLLFPGSQQTAVWDVSPAGDIVGNYRDASGVNRAFVLSRDGYDSIDVPGATLTRAWGINAAGDIVGSYVAAGVTHGYVALRVARGGV